MAARLLALLLLAAGPALADSCPEQFAGGQPPVLANPRLSADATLLCYRAFAVLHSGLSRTPLYAAERLDRARIEAARRVDRVDAFHEEVRLPATGRADLSDYGGSGYDRGHLAPSGDMPDPASQAESFSLANIVPQNPDLNRTLWAGIESAVRALAVERGELYVVTGPVFEGGNIQALKGRVLVPTRLFKAVYDPRRGEAGVYLARNAADAGWETVSPAQLAALAGIVVFPSLPETARGRAMPLPEPRRDEHAGTHRSRKAEPSFVDWLAAELTRMAKRALREAIRSLF
ncbi:DNA/RNA non-specific endonuclease [Methylobacterium sp. ID0610]|uniref:DNA/RNA non-specific endonuclease n=1 Tax=Methylobacterium carpenticola TaxID=3344827 RepID=UPI00368F485D